MSEDVHISGESGESQDKAGGAASQEDQETLSNAHEIDAMLSSLLATTKGTAREKEAKVFVAVNIIGLTAQTLSDRYRLPGSVICEALRAIAENAEASLRARGQWDGEPEKPARHSLAGYL